MCPPAKSVAATFWRGSIVLDPTNPKSIDPEVHQLLVPLLEKGVVAFHCNVSPTIVNIFNFHSKVPGRLAWAIVTKVPNIPPNSHPWDVALDSYVENDYDRKVIDALLHISDPDDITYPSDYCTMELPAQDGHGWGGKGRVILIGDSAHAMRASSGQGGSMAFEDVVVLCRALQRLCPEKLSWSNYDTISQLVLEVENTRLLRVRKIWSTEQILAEQYFVKDPNFISPATKEYLQWVRQGV
jgi:hypothetical protein